MTTSGKDSKKAAVKHTVAFDQFIEHCRDHFAHGDHVAEVMTRWIRLKAITLAVADINYRIFTIGGPRRGLEMLRYTLPLFVRMVGRALTNRPFGLTERDSTMTAHARKRAAQMAAIASCPECKHNVGLGAVDHTCELEGCCAKKDCMCQNDWHDWFELEKKVDAAFARMNVKSTVIATYD